VLDIYDSQLGMLRIGPFNYEPMRGIDLWLSQNDEFILQHLSTTPDVEPPHFVMQVRATLKFIQDNQFPGKFSLILLFILINYFLLIIFF
jgi:protein N-terminal asparagine amidohydrolase